ncbi:hypothetical protein [Streptomyces sp. NPDC059142]|uniref:hypothetical protein n=1 Tax=Streptomyces sp. NPDC059142 TaxID=3346739 RepID=UPI0036BD7A62
MVKTALATLRSELLDAITAADAAAGPSDARETLVRAAAPALSRRLVVQHLGAQDVLTIAQDAVDDSGITRNDHYSVRLTPAPDGTVTLHFDADYPEEYEREPDAYGYQDEPDEGPRHPDPHYTAEHNALGFLLTSLEAKGLSCITDGPHATVIDDLRAMEPATLRIKRTP